MPAATEAQVNGTRTDRAAQVEDTPTGGRAYPLWLKPVQEPLQIAAATKDKPLGELTMTEFLAWGAVIMYATAAGMLAGHLLANVATVALRGPVVIRR